LNLKSVMRKLRRSRWR